MRHYSLGVVLLYAKLLCIHILPPGLEGLKVRLSNLASLFAFGPMFYFF